MADDSWMLRVQIVIGVSPHASVFAESLTPIARMSASSSPSPPAPVALPTSAHEWRYLSEGKLNIVFTHNAAHSAQQAQSSPRSSNQPPSPPLIGRVLKINKNVLRSAMGAGATAASLAARLHFARDYVRCVLHPLFAHAVKSRSSTADDSLAPTLNPTAAWMDAGTIVWLDCAIIAKLINLCRSLRPLHRVAAFSSFDSTASHSTLIPVFLFEDYTSPLHLHLRRIATSGLQKSPSSLPPTVTLELKPKWGYMPSRASAASISADRAIKFSTCRYCMHQHLKLQLGEIAELSGFCPLDLFSCSPPRVRRALSQLIRTPQNNMRLFVRTGVPSGNDESEEPEAVSEGWVNQVDLQDAEKVAEVMRLLLPGFAAADSASSSSSPSQAASTARLLDFLASLICSSPHLRRMLPLLAGLQSQLDCSDIEGIHPLYAQLRESDPASLDDTVLWAGLGGDSDGATPLWMQEVIEAVAPIATADESAFADSVDDCTLFEYSPASLSDVPVDRSPICARGVSAPQPAPAPAPRKGKISRFLAAKTVLAGRIDALGEAASAAPSAGVVPASPAHTNDTNASQIRPSASISSLSNVQRLRAFLLATTLKDVSIMITMQQAGCDPSSPSSASMASASSARVHHSVRLIDLECKSVSKMNEYLRLDRQIVDVYLQHLRSLTATGS